MMAGEGEQEGWREERERGRETTPNVPFEGMFPMHLYQLGLNSEQLIKINPLVKLESSWSSHLSVNCIEVQASNKQVFEQ